MNKKQWKRLHRAARVLIHDKWADEADTVRVAKYDSLPECVKIHDYKARGYELLYLFTIFKRHVNGGVNHENARNTFRRCIRYNTTIGPHGKVGQGHPCYWDGR